MTRVKTGVVRRRRHKKRIAQTKGFRGLRSKIFKQANQAWMKAGLHAYVGRKRKKRDFRALWITRISAALKSISGEFKYSRFINALSKKEVRLNRKVLADLALHHPETFEKVVKEVM
ncbi:50S ribosomal protein L20 [bacterium]|jgi:large subunit ribosomal protein L20|nr:50S ribosomal protein L20 [bacterium]